MRTVKELLEVAVRQLNVREDPPESNNVRYNTWYYGREVHGKAYPWCMVVNSPRCRWSCPPGPRAALL